MTKCHFTLKLGKVMAVYNTTCILYLVLVQTKKKSYSTTMNSLLRPLWQYIQFDMIISTALSDQKSKDFSDKLREFDIQLRRGV